MKIKLVHQTVVAVVIHNNNPKPNKMEKMQKMES